MTDEGSSRKTNGPNGCGSRRSLGLGTARGTAKAKQSGPLFWSCGAMRWAEVVLLRGGQYTPTGRGTPAIRNVRRGMELRYQHHKRRPSTRPLLQITSAGWSQSGAGAGRWDNCLEPEPAGDRDRGSPALKGLSHRVLPPSGRRRSSDPVPMLSASDVFHITVDGRDLLGITLSAPEAGDVPVWRVSAPGRWSPQQLGHRGHEGHRGHRGLLYGRVPGARMEPVSAARVLFLICGLRRGEAPVGAWSSPGGGDPQKTDRRAARRGAHHRPGSRTLRLSFVSFASSVFELLRSQDGQRRAGSPTTES